MDAYAKTVLTVIAACLALQVAQGFGLGGTPEPAQMSASGGETALSYRMVPVGMTRQVFRFNQATGQTWTMPLKAKENLSWTPVEEAPPEAMVPKRAPLQPKKKADEKADGAEE